MSNGGSGYSARFSTVFLFGVTVAVMVCALVSNAAEPQTPPPTKVDVPPLVSKYQIDKDRQIFTGIVDDKPIQSEGENPDEFLSYNEVVLFANQFSVTELEEHGRKDVTYKDLMSRFRSDFKLELIHFEGRLGRLRKIEPNKQLSGIGIKELYEAWIFPKDTNETVCVLLTQAPEGIKPELNYTPTPRVTFAGYYFKVMQYEMTMKDSKDPNKGKLGRAPFLIGRSLTLVPDPPFTPGEQWRATFLPVLIGVLGAVTVIGLLLAWWLRRGDQDVKKLIAARTDQNPFPS